MVTTYIMAHALTIAEETKISALSKMQSYTESNSYTSTPYILNCQLKYFFARLQRGILSKVLKNLQHIFKSSTGCNGWVAAFITVIVMAMALERQQKNIHQVMHMRAVAEGFEDAQAQADFACSEIDARMKLIGQIFSLKYNSKYNPFKNPEHRWNREVGFKKDKNSLTFVRSVTQLVRDNSKPPSLSTYQNV